MLDKQGVANALRQQFGPHAKIDKIEQTSMAKMAAERAETYKRSEEKKRMQGDFGAYGKKSKQKHYVNLEDGECWWLVVGIGKDAPERYEITMPGRAHHVIRVVPESAWHRHDCDGCEKEIFSDPGDCQERRVWLCQGCRVEQGFFHEWESQARRDYRRRIESFTKKGIGGLELRNENLGCFMSGHGDPAFVEHMRRTGQIQVRKDERGNPCEYLISNSRKHMNEQLKNFNDAQKRAEDRGWRGTYSHGSYDVKRLNHGGMSPSRSDR